MMFWWTLSIFNSIQWIY